MGYEDWNQTGTGINHGPSSGIRYLGQEKNKTLIQARSKLRKEHLNLESSGDQ